VIYAQSKEHLLPLLTESERPPWFTYPREFIRLVETGLTSFPPWRIIETTSVVTRMNGLRERYLNRESVPFATRLDCDDLACWERGKMPIVIVIHDFASSGWEQRRSFDGLWEWFRSAINDFIEFDG
jgi:hypothetical protein